VSLGEWGRRHDRQPTHGDTDTGHTMGDGEIPGKLRLVNSEMRRGRAVLLRELSGREALLGRVGIGRVVTISDTQM
jgi:hypothetical protein